MFNLTEYAPVIRTGAANAQKNVSTEVARFVYNLRLLRPAYDEFPESVNFRTLGQQWNALTSDERNRQCAEVTQLLFNNPTV